MFNVEILPVTGFKMGNDLTFLLSHNFETVTSCFLSLFVFARTYRGDHLGAIHYVTKSVVLSPENKQFEKQVIVPSQYVQYLSTEFVISFEVSLNPYGEREKHFDTEPTLTKEETEENKAEDDDEGTKANESDPLEEKILPQNVLEKEPILFSFNGEMPIFLPTLQIEFLKEKKENGDVDDDGLPSPALLQTTSSTSDSDSDSVSVSDSESESESKSHRHVRSLTSDEIYEIEHEMSTSFHSEGHSHRLHQEEYEFRKERKEREKQDEMTAALDIELRQKYPGVEIENGIGVFPPHSKIDIAVSLINPFRELDMDYEQLTFSFRGPIGKDRTVPLKHARLDQHHMLTLRIRNIPTGHSHGLHSVIVHMTAVVKGTPVVFSGSIDFVVGR